MKPLLEIQTTPARYEYEMSHAKLVKSDKPATSGRQVSRAAVNMRKQAGRVEMGSVRRKSDMNIVDRTRTGAKTTVDSTGKSAVPVNGAGDYTSIGSQLAGASGQTQVASVADSMWGRTMQHSKGELVLVPVSPVELHYIPASLAMNYQQSEVNTNWNVGLAKLDFVPSSFRLNFTEFASISITYTGGPLYVPPSADPNFEAQA